MVPFIVYKYGRALYNYIQKHIKLFLRGDGALMKMPSWLENSLRTGFELKEKAIILECWKMWNEILIRK